jgi:hypothetical protein
VTDVVNPLYLRVPRPGSTSDRAWDDITLLQGDLSTRLYPDGRLRLLTNTGWKAQTTIGGYPLYLRMRDGTWQWVMNLQAGLPALDVLLNSYDMTGSRGNPYDDVAVLAGPVSHAVEWHENHDDLLYDTFYGTEAEGRVLAAGCSSYLFVPPLPGVSFDWHGPNHQSVLVLDTTILPVTPTGYLLNPVNGSLYPVDMAVYPPSPDPLTSGSSLPWSSVDIEFTYNAVAGCNDGATHYYPDTGTFQSYLADLAATRFYLTRLDIASLVQPTAEIITGPARSVYEEQFVGRVTSRFAQTYLGGNQGTDILTFTTAGANALPDDETGSPTASYTHTHTLTPADVDADNGLVAFGLFSDFQRHGGTLPDVYPSGIGVYYGWIRANISWNMRVHYPAIT